MQQELTAGKFWNISVRHQDKKRLEPTGTTDDWLAIPATLKQDGVIVDKWISCSGTTRATT